MKEIAATYILVSVIYDKKHFTEFIFQQLKEKLIESNNKSKFYDT